MKKMERQDNGFTRGLTEETSYKAKRRERINKELTKQDKLQIAKNKADTIRLQRIEEVIANNYGFTDYKVYELYRAELMSSHDIYRKDQMSQIWRQNSLWNDEQDNIQTEGIQSNRLRFEANKWLKKISWLQLHELQNRYKSDNEKWFDSTMFLVDRMTIHDKPLKTPCKRLELTCSQYSNIKTKDLWQLRVTCYAVKGQYYCEHVEENLDSKEYKPRVLPNLPRMIEKKTSQFELNHISRFGDMFLNRANYKNPDTACQSFDFLSKQAKLEYSDIDKYLDLNSVSQAEIDRDIIYQNQDDNFYDDSDIVITKESNLDYEISLNDDSLAEFLTVE